MEKEKNKSKSHPFAGYLRESEEVLWMSGQAPDSATRKQMVAMGVTIFGVAAAVAFGLVSDGDMKSDEKLKIFLGVMGLTLVGILGWLLLWGLSRLIRGVRQPERIYAVTNERLLYRSKKSVSSIALEALPPVSLFLGENNKGTFSFGAFFPMWPDVEDAITVKHLIDDAQRQRKTDMR